METLWNNPAQLHAKLQYIFHWKKCQKQNKMPSIQNRWRIVNFTSLEQLKGDRYVLCQSLGYLFSLWINCQKSQLKTSLCSTKSKVCPTSRFENNNFVFTRKNPAKCWFPVNVQPQRCVFTENSKMLILQQCVTTEILIPLKRRTLKCWFHMKKKTVKCWL